MLAPLVSRLRDQVGSEYDQFSFPASAVSRHDRGTISPVGGGSILYQSKEVLHMG